MAIYKNRHYGNFTQIDNAVIRSGLSDKALGALVRLLSHSENWKFSIKSFAHERNVSEKRTSTVIHELIDAGHVEEIKDRNEKGQFIHGYNVYEIPQVKNDKPTTSEPKEKKPPVKKDSKRTPSVDKPRPENPRVDSDSPIPLLYNKKRFTKKEKQKESEKSNRTQTSSFSKPKRKFGSYQNVLLTDEEYQHLCEDYGPKETDRSIEGMSNYMEINGKKYNNTMLRLEQWIKEDVEKYGYFEPENVVTQEEWHQSFERVKNMMIERGWITA
ncbi:MAG: hypothetical protein K2J32_04750 [Ruminococcus sp.]|nr:hypothetical protein [Ruminococcus sp.]